MYNCNTVVSCKAYPGADIPSDHNLLVALTKLRFKKRILRTNVRKITSDNIIHQTKDKINEEIKNISENNNQDTEKRNSQTKQKHPILQLHGKN